MCVFALNLKCQPSDLKSEWTLAISYAAKSVFSLFCLLFTSSWKSENTDFYFRAVVINPYLFLDFFVDQCPGPGPESSDLTSEDTQWVSVCFPAFSASSALDLSVNFQRLTESILISLHPLLPLTQPLLHSISNPYPLGMCFPEHHRVLLCSFVILNI